MKRRAIVIFAMVLVACGTSPPTRYYALSEPAPTSVDKTGHAVVALGPLMLADYLQRPQIVVRGDDQRLRVADFDRWAEPPDRAIARWLAREVDRQLAAGTVVEASGAPNPDYRIRGQIAQWDVDTTTNAVLVVQWAVVDRDGGATVAMRTSRYTAPVRSATDYSDVVRGLNRTLADFAADVAAALARALPMT
jgi:hypothetical protein